LIADATDGIGVTVIYIQPASLNRICQVPGYIYSFIAQKQYDGSKTYYSLKTYLENDIALDFAGLTHDTIYDFKLNPKIKVHDQHIF